MKWNDVTEDAQAEWLASDVTQAFLGRVREEEWNARDAAVASLRDEKNDERHYTATRHIGAMDAFVKVRRIAEDKR